MPGTTPIYKLPYPTQTDPIWQGATQMQDLAQRIEAVLNANGLTAPAAATEPADPDVLGGRGEPGSVNADE